MEKYETRSVNWSHPMSNSTHLPPKSPHGAYSMFSSTSLFEAPSVGTSNLPPPPPPPPPGSHHRRSPSAGYVPPQAGGGGGPHPAWLSDRLASPDVVLKKCSHRRSSSDSVAFVDNSYQYMNYLENVTEEDEFLGMGMQEAATSAYRPAHRRGISADHGSSGDPSPPYKLPVPPRSHSEKASRGDHNFHREQFPRLRDNEGFQRQQPRHEPPLATAYPRGSVPKPGSQELFLKAKKAATSAHPSSFGGPPSRGGKSLAHWSSTSSGGGNSNSISGSGSGNGATTTTTTTSAASFENRSTASESASHSDDSNDDRIARGYERFEGRSEEGEGAQDGCASSDQVDPKKAKRILANRQSAQRSRVRKLQYILELEMNVNLLETEVASLSPKVGFYDHERALLNAENAVLRQKLVALANTQQQKEAYNETLRTELQRLRQICTSQPSPSLHQQQHFSHPPIQRPLSPDALELQLLRFGKLDLGSPGLPKPKSPTAAYTTRTNSSGRPSLYPTTKMISPTRSPSASSRPFPQRVPPSCMAPGGGGGNKPLGGGMMGATTSFMVHNS